MKIFQIEITNECNFTCHYCPHPIMKRKKEPISYEIIDRIAEVITSKKVRFHHYGESLLELDRLIYAIRKIKEKNINIITELNTNGEYLTKDTCRKVIEAGLDSIIISYHNEKSLLHINELIDYKDKITIIKIAPIEDIDKYRERLKGLKEKGFKVQLKRLRDLGQLKADKFREGYKTCSFLLNNEFVVFSNGNIAPCCEVYENEYILGNIMDPIEKLNSLENKVFKMCRTCEGYGNDNFETEKIEI